MAKNLSDWAEKNKNYTIQPDMEKIIKAFHKAGKPLGMCCISPILAAKILPGCELTLGHDQMCSKYVNPFVTVESPHGKMPNDCSVFLLRWPYAQTAEAVMEMGCKHVNTDVDKAHVDVKNKLVTTCAFMCNAPVHQVFDGIGVMVSETLKLA